MSKPDKPLSIFWSIPVAGAQAVDHLGYEGRAVLAAAASQAEYGVGAYRSKVAAE